MYFPDYGPCIARVGLWIAQGVSGMTLNKTLFLENYLPPGPDGAQCLFEYGGTWNEERGWQDWTLMLATRAATLAQARKLAGVTIATVLESFPQTPVAQRSGIQDVQLQSLPSMAPRDKDTDRILIETRFLMRIQAEYIIGLER